MSEQQITKESIAYLKTVLLSQLLLEANEEIVATNRYKQSLKKQKNRTNSIVEPIVREEFDNVYKTDPEMATNILNKVESIIDKIASYQIEELVILESIVDKYENNKEWFLKYAESDFLRLVYDDTNTLSITRSWGSQEEMTLDNCRKMLLRRSEKVRVALVLILPQWHARPPLSSVSTTAKPVEARPGSTPIALIRAIINTDYQFHLGV